MIKTHTLIVLISMLCMLLSSQIALSQNYKDIFKSKYSVSIDSAKAYSEELIQSNQLNLKAFGFVAKGYIFTKQGDYENAKESFNKGFQEIETIEKTSLKTEVKVYALYYYSLYFLTQHELEKANQYINEGLKLLSSSVNVEMQIQFRDLFVSSFSLAGLYKEALKNDVEIIKLTKQLESNELFLSKDYSLNMIAKKVGSNSTYVPIYSPKKIVQTVKSILARDIFRLHPEVKQQLWGGQFWSKGYYLNTVG